VNHPSDARMIHADPFGSADCSWDSSQKRCRSESRWIAGQRSPVCDATI